MDHYSFQCSVQTESKYNPTKLYHSPMNVYCPECQKVICVNCMISHFLTNPHNDPNNYILIDVFSKEFLPNMKKYDETLDSLYRETRPKNNKNPELEKAIRAQLSAFNTLFNQCIAEISKVKDIINSYYNHMISLCHLPLTNGKSFNHIIEEDKYHELKAKIRGLEEQFLQKRYNLFEFFDTFAKLGGEIASYHSKSINTEQPRKDFFNTGGIDPKEIERYHLIRKMLNFADILNLLRDLHKSLEMQSLPKLNDSELEKIIGSVVKKEVSDKMDIVPNPPSEQSNIPANKIVFQLEPPFSVKKEKEFDTPKFAEGIKQEKLEVPKVEQKIPQINGSIFSFGRDYSKDEQQFVNTTKKQSTVNKRLSEISSESSSPRAKEKDKEVKEEQILGKMFRSDRGQEIQPDEEPPKRKRGRPKVASSPSNKKTSLPKNQENKYLFTAENLLTIHKKKVLIYNAKSNKIFQTMITAHNCQNKWVFQDLNSLEKQKYINVKGTLIITGGVDSKEKTSNLVFQITVNSELIERLANDEILSEEDQNKVISITRLYPMVEARQYHNIIYFPILNRLYAVSGKNSKTWESLKLDSNDRWRTYSSTLNCERANATMFVFNETYLYIVGGCEMSNKSYQDGYEYTRADKSQGWKRVQVNNQILSISSMGVMYKDRNSIILLGGANGEHKYLSGMLELSMGDDGLIKDVAKTANAINEGVRFYSSYAFHRCGERFLNWEYKTGPPSLVEYDVKNNKFAILEGYTICKAYK